MIAPFTRNQWHLNIYWSGLLLLVLSLPLSRFSLSISIFLLFINWVAEGRFTEKWRLIWSNTPLLLFICIFFFYCAGLVTSENHTIGLMKVKNVLPLLLIPIITVTSPRITEKRLKTLLLVFSCAVFLAALLCTVNFYMHYNSLGNDQRNISIFIGHTCFALQVNMAVFILLYFLFKNSSVLIPYEKIVIGILLLMLAVFLLFLRSFTGTIIFFLLVSVFLINVYFNRTSKLMRTFIAALIITFTVILVFSGAIYVKRNFYAAPVDESGLEQYTVNRNIYNNTIRTGLLENGNYTELYVCEPEVIQGWNKISRIVYDSLDLRGQLISETIKRYLTSRGLRKDSVGISQLGYDDILAIENGITNYKFKSKRHLLQRFYETLWEIHVYQKTGYVKYHSFGQRLLFLKGSWNTMLNNWKTGVGTGDVYSTLRNNVLQTNTEVDPSWEGKPHNQYVFWVLAFGIFGFTCICLCWLLPVLNTKAHTQLLFNLFAAIILISMLSFDTFETYDGIVFIVFFYSLFVFGKGNRVPEQL